MLPLALLLIQSTVDPQPTYSGRHRQLDVPIPRVDTPVAIDGVLDEPVWREAARLRGFSQYRPADGRPAEDSTEVLVWYQPDAVVFGIRAFESHGAVVRATLADRDQIDADDHVRIPFKSIRYRSADPQDWGIQVLRTTQHSGYEDTWTPAVRASASFLVQSGRLRGLTGLRRGLVMDVTPEFTTRVDGTPRAGRPYLYVGEPQLGGTLRWGATTNLSLSATVNPDFSQVEADVGQVTVNERFALFFPEKRPFFLEGLEQYDTPNRLIYTRRIAAPLAGAKLTGKA